MLADEGRGERRRVEVRAALEAMAGVGVEAVAARGAADGDRVKPGGFDEDVLRVGGDHRVPAAHDSGEAEGLCFVGNDEVFGIEGALDAVEGLELFAFLGAAHDDAALDLVEVEGVRGLAHGEPGVVGGIDGVGDLLLLEQVEVGGNLAPGNQSRIGDGDATQDAAGEAAAGVRGFDAHGKAGFAAGFGQRRVASSAASLRP